MPFKGDLDLDRYLKHYRSVMTLHKQNETSCAKSLIAMTLQEGTTSGPVVEESGKDENLKTLESKG